MVTKSLMVSLFALYVTRVAYLWPSVTWVETYVAPASLSETGCRRLTRVLPLESRPCKTVLPFPSSGKCPYPWSVPLSIRCGRKHPKLIIVSDSFARMIACYRLMDWSKVNYPVFVAPNLEKNFTCAVCHHKSWTVPVLLRTSMCSEVRISTNYFSLQQLVASSVHNKINLDNEWYEQCRVYECRVIHSSELHCEVR